jgi:signal transduction histidine kinase
MAVVLATPFVAGRALRWVIGGGAAVAGLVGSIGLLNDDGGVVVDIADELEFGLVVGALVAQIIPIGLIVWQNNQLQLGALAEAQALNEELAQSQTLLSESRRRVVAAADAERSRIERDLHDGAQARLVAIGIRLRLLEARASGTELAGDVAELVTEIEGASVDLRELSHGIYPPLLETRGLREAIAAAARRFDGVSVVDLTDVGRLGRDVESALYFTCLEALSNASKHAGGAPIAVSLARNDGHVALIIADDGPGFDTAIVERSHGIVNMSDRIAVAGGSLDIDSGPGGTRVEARVPAGG